MSEELPDRCPSCDESWLLGDRYALVRELGRGGMSTVYAARDTEGEPEDPLVAVKVSSVADGDVTWKGYELFERSSQVLEHLDEHPGLPVIHTFFRDPRGALVLVREQLAGGTLRERVTAGQVTAEVLPDLLSRLLEILAFLHSRQPVIVHRDIKPHNIMFRTARDWQPVLVDFDTLAVPTGSGLTLVGTPGYAAPEQLMGETSPASDIYGMGATMLFAVTGEAPEKWPRTGGRLALEGRLDHLPARWRTALPRMLAASLDKRLQDADEVRAVLSDSRPQSDSEARPGWLMPALVAVALAAIVVFWWLGRSPPKGAGAGSHEALLEAGLRAVQAGDVEAYEALMMPASALDRLCQKAKPSERAAEKRRLQKKLARLPKRLDECRSSIDFARARRVQLTPGKRSKAIEECTDVVAFRAAKAVFETERARVVVKLDDATSYKDGSGATRWGFADIPRCSTAGGPTERP